MAPGHYGSLPIVGGRGGFPISTRDIAAMSGNKPSGDSGCGGDTASLTSLYSGLSAGVPSLQGGTDAISLTEAYVQALMLARLVVIYQIYICMYIYFHLIVILNI